LTDEPFVVDGVTRVAAPLLCAPTEKEEVPMQSSLRMYLRLSVLASTAVLLAVMAGSAAGARRAPVAMRPRS